MKASHFDYELPEDRIATHPTAERDGSRLLVVGREGTSHACFRDWPELVPEGSLVVLNDTRVFKARIEGTRARTGGRVEFLLTRRLEANDDTDELWLALGRANKPLDVGSAVDAGSLSVEVVGRENDLLRVRVRAAEGVATALEAQGRVPLPPYMRRRDETSDVERYQTVFARSTGSVAAPTAGLHLTPATLERLRARGVDLAFTTLHVGLGTFRPVSVDDLDDHDMHAEWFEVTEALAAAVRNARARGGKVVAVGTTVVRALESARNHADPRVVVPCARETRLLIQPGYGFGPVDALLTNFHQPRSTLLALVAAFAGRDRVFEAYRAAIAAEYRFLSYGDAMWLPERVA